MLKLPFNLKSVFFVLAILSSQIVTPQIRKFYSDIVKSTVSLNKKDKSGNLLPHGVGFMLYNYDTSSQDQIMITCKHLINTDTLFALIPAADSIRDVLRKTKSNALLLPIDTINNKIYFDGNNFLYPIPLSKGINLFTHDNLDLAIVYCNFGTRLNFGNQSIILADNRSLPTSFIAKRNDIYTGLEVVFLGFPYSIGTKYGFNGSSEFSDVIPNPLARKGIVAWTSTKSNMFLIDGFSFSGNSGSPIFSVPYDEEGGKFIGMVLGHLMDTVLLRNAEVDKISGKIVSSLRVIDLNNLLAIFIPSFIIMDFRAETDRRRNLIRMFKSN